MTTKVNQQTDAARAHADSWQLCTDLLGGTAAMRKAGERYLPKRRLETTEDHANRVKLSTLYPGFAPTVDKLTSRVFAEPLQPITEAKDSKGNPQPKVPDWIVSDVLPDVDRQDRNLQVFAYDWFHGALSHGLFHVIVDSPPAAPGMSEADQRAAKIRPYAILIKPERVLGWMQDDSGKLTQLRVMFSRSEPDGEFGTKEVPQVRVYEPGRVRVFERNDPKKSEEYFQVGPESIMAVNGVPLQSIPIVTFYTQRTGFMQGKSPLDELARLNAKHWWMQSGNDALVDTASVPILCATGVQDDTSIVIGAKNAVILPEGGSLKYVEHTGAAIKAGRDSLLALEDAMRQAGAKLAQKSEQTKTATQATEEAASDNSALGGMVRKFEDALAALMDMFAMWRGEKSGGRIKVTADLTPDEMPIESMQVLVSMANGGMISKQGCFEEAKERGIVSASRDWEAEQARMAEDDDGLGRPPAARTNDPEDT